MFVPILPGRKADAALWQSAGAISQTSASSAPRGKFSPSVWIESWTAGGVTIPSKHVRFAGLKADAPTTSMRRLASPQPSGTAPTNSNSNQKRTSHIHRPSPATTMDYGGNPEGHGDFAMTEAGGMHSGEDEATERNAEHEDESMDIEAGEEHGDEEDGENGGEEHGEDGDADGDDEEAESEREVAHVPSDRLRQHDHLEMVHFNQVFRHGRELCCEVDGHAFVDHEDPVYQHGGRAHRVLLDDQQHLDVMICDPDFCVDCGAEEDPLSESSNDEKKGLPFVHSADLERAGKYLTYRPTPRPLLGSHKKSSRWMRSVCFESNGPLICKVLVCDFRHCALCLSEMQRPHEEMSEPGESDEGLTHTPSGRTVALLQPNDFNDDGLEAADPNHAKGGQLATSADSSFEQHEETYLCDSCDQKIDGVRYSCAPCNDVDYCEGCFKSARDHHQGHQFKRFEPR